jgi:hypothetical protein
MGNLSEHFNKEDFSCRCNTCRNEYRMSLTLVGILEDLTIKLAVPLKIIRGFVCENAEISEQGPKKNYHSSGKAVDFSLPPGKLIEAFRYLETFPEITGLGVDLENNYIHVDLREKDPTKWSFRRGDQQPLTPELRSQQGLGENVEKTKVPDSVSLELPVEIA